MSLCEILPTCSVRPQSVFLWLCRSTTKRCMADASRCIGIPVLQLYALSNVVDAVAAITPSTHGYTPDEIRIRNTNRLWISRATENQQIRQTIVRRSSDLTVRSLLSENPIKPMKYSVFVLRFHESVHKSSDDRQTIVRPFLWNLSGRRNCRYGLP